MVRALEIFTVDYRFAPGSSFAGYTIDAPIGSGSAGETYRARRAGTRINVALKIAWPELAAAPGFAFAMQRQARILQRFRHPNLCAVVDSGISKGLPFWVSEFVPGPRGEPFSLKEYLAERVGRGLTIGEEEVFIISQEIIGTLAALHAFRDKEECPDGFALGDLRPVNILLDAETKFRLCDLGISSLVRSITHSFPGSKGIGVGYMSPEVRAGEPPTPRSDVYSVGAIMYELLTGHKFSAEAAPPSQVRKGIKSGWDALLMKRCLAENPDDRLADMESLKLVLENLEQGRRGGTLVLSKKSETQEVVPLAEDGQVPADLAGQTTIARPRTMTLRKIGADTGPAQTTRSRTTLTKKMSVGAEAVSQEVAQAETISFKKPPARSAAKAAVAPKKKTGLWVGLGIAAVLLCGGPAYYFATKGSAAGAAGTNALARASTPIGPVATQAWKLVSFGVEMKWIPPATALIGTDDADAKALEATLPVGESHVLGYEKPKEVSLSNGFWLAATEVTIGQWRQFMAKNPDFRTSAEKKKNGQSIRTNGEFGVVSGVNWSNPFPGQAVSDNQPVTCVVPADIQLFCAWLTNLERDAGRIGPEYSFRLPTEFEWEHACRGDAKTRTRFWWGSDAAGGAGRINAAGTEFTKTYPGQQKYGFDWNDTFVLTSPVGSFGANGTGEFGLSDMLGNVWECVSRPNLPGQAYAWRGGSFAEGHTIVRCASVRHRYSDSPSANAGFRLCLSK